MDLIQNIERRLKKELPGLEAQLLMASKSINPQIFKNQKSNAKKAAVILLLFQKEKKWYTLLMQRPPSPYAHSSQISFPGGGYEPNKDKSLQATALRETEEEFGIPPTNIKLLGALTPIYISVSNYLVHPYIGYMNKIPVCQPDPNEVAEILEIPLADLFNPQLRKAKNIPTSSNYILKNVPYFDLHQKTVWGATAMILSEFISITENI